MCEHDVQIAIRPRGRLCIKQYMSKMKFPIRKYLAMVDGTLEDKDVNSWEGIWYGLQRLALGVVYLILFSLLYPKMHAKYFVSEWYENIPLLHQWWCIIWFQEFLWMKYLGLFLISEGNCIVSGLGYNGKTEDGKAKWDGVTNMKILSYETSYTVQPQGKSLRFISINILMVYHSYCAVIGYSTNGLIKN
ncbi:Lysophospholipid acyltransferase 5 [Exaiptasia diaphana]|nr:Lysophospholipid acyltransferase 5 [Exaiptasia diaphana]